MKKVYVPFRYIYIIQQILQKNNKQNIGNKHFFDKAFVEIAQEMLFDCRLGRKTALLF